MKFLVVVFCASCIGCTTVPQTRDVLVTVPCKVEEPPAPEYRFKPPYDNVFVGVRDLLGDRERSLAYEEELRTALRSCR